MHAMVNLHLYGVTYLIRGGNQEIRVRFPIGSNLCNWFLQILSPVKSWFQRFSKAEFDYLFLIKTVRQF
jgi:hypothetical protein